MPLTIAYVNEVLNHLPSTVVVSEQEWPRLVQALKFEGRDLTACILGQMRLRWAPGGYEGLLKQLDSLTQERDQLAGKVEELTKTLDSLTEPLPHAPSLP